MKKISIFLAFVLIFALCGGNQTSEEPVLTTLQDTTTSTVQDTTTTMLQDTTTTTVQDTTTTMLQDTTTNDTEEKVSSVEKEVLVTSVWNSISNFVKQTQTTHSVLTMIRLKCPM